MKLLRIWFSGRAIAAVVCGAMFVFTSVAYGQGPEGNAGDDGLSSASVSAKQPVILNLMEIDEQLAVDSAAVDGLRQKVLVNEPQVTVVLLSLEKDGVKANHSAPGTATINVVTGSVDFEVLGKSHLLTAGQVIVLEPELNHNLKAREKSLVQVTISKSGAGAGAH